MRFSIARAPIDVPAIAGVVRSDACGAVVTFVGVVRERGDDGRAVAGLRYEAHEAMAVAEFGRIAAQARERYGDCEIAIAHRVGELCVGEVAVVVAAASVHRDRAFDACEFAIDELKARAPIWKSERYADGSANWIANA